jgi:hypothetical protein
MSDKLFDIVIPLGPNDYNTISLYLKYTITHIIGYRNIYIITPMQDIYIDNCIIINDNVFPFTINDIKKYHGDLDRNGWYLQQLIKLYAGFVIPDIMDNYLVIDADIIFFNKSNFIENGKFLFNTGTEYHIPYFEHMYRLHPSLVRVEKNISGITHHMIFNKFCIRSLFDMIEKEHNNDDFWKIFLYSVCEKDRKHSGASEYEIYFNYMLIYHSDKIELRKLNYIEINKKKLDYYINNSNNLDYIACHWYKE